jgi:hypothetical protein
MFFSFLPGSNFIPVVILLVNRNRIARMPDIGYQIPDTRYQIDPLTA